MYYGEPGLKTRVKILIFIVVLMVVLGITGTSLIRKAFFLNRMQPNLFYSRAEAEYLLEHLNQGNVVLFEDITDSSSLSEADDTGVTVADIKKAMQVILGLSKEQTEDLIRIQYENTNSSNKNLSQTDLNTNEDGTVQTNRNTDEDAGIETRENTEKDDSAQADVFAFLYRAKDSDLVSIEDFHKIYDFFIESIEDTSVEKISFMLLDLSERKTANNSDGIVIAPGSNYILSGYSE